jgi:hypothetical protein
MMHGYQLTKDKIGNKMQNTLLDRNGSLKANSTKMRSEVFLTMCCTHAAYIGDMLAPIAPMALCTCWPSLWVCVLRYSTNLPTYLQHTLYPCMSQNKIRRFQSTCTISGTQLWGIVQGTRAHVDKCDSWVFDLCWTHLRTQPCS